MRVNSKSTTIELHKGMSFEARLAAGKVLRDACPRKAVTLSGYMGKSDAFDQAIAAFSVAYADQNEKDHAALAAAVRKSKVKAVYEEAR